MISPLARTLSRILLATACTGLSLQAAELKFSLAPEAENGQLGSAFAALGDIDGDGIVDIAVADQSYSFPDSSASGIVYLLSGADGSLIRNYDGIQARSQNFGFALATLDADGDGVSDLAVGATGTANEDGPSAGAVWIYSGADGSVISSTIGSSRSAYGSALANAGDRNGDGFDELFVGAPFANSRGEVTILSAADGTTLGTIPAPSATSGFGSKIAALGDIDQDGLLDLAISAPYYQVEGRSVGQVSIFRSSDLSSVAQTSGSGYNNNLGTSLSQVADANDDEFPDLLIGSFSGGNCYVCSGTDLSLITDLSIPDFAPYQPLTAGGSLDADGDGVADWLIGSRGMRLDGYNPYGGLRIVSGADQSLLFEYNSESIRSGLGDRLAVLPGFGFAAGETWLLDPLTNGRGSAHIWEVEQVESNPDTDGDGIPDDIDAVIDSVMDPTLLFLGFNSGVENRIDADGLTLADHYASINEPTTSNRKALVRYISRVIHKSLRLYRKGLITKSEVRAIHRSAVRGAITLLRHRRK